MRQKSIVTALLALLVVAAHASGTPTAVNRAQGTYRSEAAGFRLTQLVADLEHPWAIAFLPDGRTLITERPGRLWSYDGRAVTRIDGLPQITASGQGGLLDLIPDPDFERNNLIYFSYSSRFSGGLGTTVARARLSGSRLVDVQEIWRQNRASAGGRHFGSRLAFDRAGMLLITIGDRGQQDRSQDPNDHAGTLVRIAPDGSVPADNPFVRSGDGAADVWSYGHRNAQGIAINPDSGEIWLHEHGPQGGDELNIARAGDNHGWPVITHGANYGTGTRIGIGTSAPGMEEPLIHWTPSIAPSGMAFYTGDLMSGWRGDIFIGALAGQHLRRVVIDGDRVVHQEVLLDRAIGRIRDVRQGPDGHLYLITDDRRGSLYRIDPQ